MRYVVVGCGAVGGLYGARLAAAGHDVGFLVRSDRDALRRDGLRVDSVDGDIVLPPGSFAVDDDPTAFGSADAVIVAVKTTSSPSIAPLVGTFTSLVVFQNGLGVEAVAAAAAPGAAAVVGGMCFVCSTKVAPAHIRHVDYGAVTLAPHRGSMDAVDAIANDLRAAGVDVSVTPDLVTARWRKLLWSVPFNGLTALLGVGTDDLLKSPTGRALVADIMEEVLAAAVACGAALSAADVADMVQRTEAMVPYRTSMALDLDAGRPLEHDAIYGAPVRAAFEAGAAMPRVETLYRVLDVLNHASTTNR
jgi:2-dehydropantoate 2-reductase